MKRITSYIIITLLLWCCGGFLFVSQAQAILCQDNFSDGNYNQVDPTLVNGLSWSVRGSGIVNWFGDPINRHVFSLWQSSRALSDQSITSNEFTIDMDVLISYNQPARIIFLFLDENNYYYFGITGDDKGLYRIMNGVKVKLNDGSLDSFMSLPRGNPTRANYKIYLKNDSISISIAVDKDRFNNGKGYELEVIDTDQEAAAKFRNGKIGFEDYVPTFDNSRVCSIGGVNVYAGRFEDLRLRPAATRYVDAASGVDTYEGTSRRPFKTIARAIVTSLPSDSIIVRPGVYEEQIHFAPFKIYGEQGNLLTIKSEPRRAATISGVDTSNAPYVRIEGFSVNVGPIIAAGSFVQIIDNYVYDAIDAGIAVSGDNIYVANNKVYRCGKGIVVNGREIVIENNEIERLYKWSYFDADYFCFFGENITIRGNHLHGTTVEEIGDSHTDGFQTYDDNGSPVHNVIIEDNLLEGFFHQGFMGEARSHNSTDLVFRNNIFYDGGHGIMSGDIQNFTIVNNIFCNLRGMTIILNGAGPQNIIKNNIIYDCKTGYTVNADSGFQAGNNLIFSSTDKLNPADWPNDIINQDPLFIDVDNKDLHLHAISPAIDAGIDLQALGFALDREGASRPSGRNWDIGPYEYHGERDNSPQAIIKLTKQLGAETIEVDQGYEPLVLTCDGTKSYETSEVALVAYRWNFDDGSAAEGETVVHSFNEGTHNVSLTVTDAAGKISTAYKQVRVAYSEYPNLYLWLSMDETATDKSGKNMAAEWLKGEARYADGAIGKAAAFSPASGAHISVAQNSYLDGMGSFTVAFWAKKNDAFEAQHILYEHATYSFDLTQTGLSAYFAGNSISASQGSNDTLWHHYAITYDGAAAKMYIDGREVASKAFSGNVAHNIWWPIAIGRDPWGNAFNGLIDELLMYDCALTLDEIASLARKEMPTSKLDFGDVSGDGVVSAYDAALCSRIAVGLDPLGDKLTVADVNGDGVVSAYDAALIAQRAVGLIEKFPVE